MRLGWLPRSHSVSNFRLRLTPQFLPSLPLFLPRVVSPAPITFIILFCCLYDTCHTLPSAKASFWGYKQFSPLSHVPQTHGCFLSFLGVLADTCQTAEGQHLLPSKGCESLSVRPGHIAPTWDAIC